MKLLEQYIYAIGKKLPYKSRNEIKMELKSAFLDELEAKYGKTPPSEADIESLIASHGAPREVASRYKTDNVVIGSGYTDLFFMIMKIIIFALTIAFTVTFVVELLSGDLKNSIMVIEVLKIPGNVISGSLSAFGSLTIVFIILTKFNTDEKINLDEDWKPSELKDIQVGPEEESKVGSAFAIFFILIFVSVINSSPHLVNVAERAFESSGLELGHYIHLETFKYFLIPLTIIWLGELVYHTINIFTGSSRALASITSCWKLVDSSLC